MGFGDSDADVAALRIADPELLVDYLEAVVEAPAGMSRTSRQPSWQRSSTRTMARR